MTAPARFGAAVVLALVAGLGGLGGMSACGDEHPRSSASRSTPSAPEGPTAAAEYAPVIDPAGFADRIDNLYMPLAVGSWWRYEGVGDDGETEVVEITVLDETREVLGVTTRVVRDRVLLDDEVVEDTFDWFAQDADGNVWYFGEDVKDYENGQLVSTDGSWEAGVGGALPGIVMPADPQVGARYRQEYLPDEAEDMFEIIDLGGIVSTPAGQFHDVLVTRDWTPLEPEVTEEKSYTKGIGKVAERTVAGGSSEVQLTARG